MNEQATMQVIVFNYYVAESKIAAQKLGARYHSLPAILGGAQSRKVGA